MNEIRFNTWILSHLPRHYYRTISYTKGLSESDKKDARYGRLICASKNVLVLELTNNRIFLSYFSNYFTRIAYG